MALYLDSPWNFHDGINFKHLETSLYDKTELERRKKGWENMAISISSPQLPLSNITGVFPLETRWQITIYALLMEIPTYRSFIANRALNHMLVKLAIQVDERLAHAAVYYWNPTGIGTGNGCIRRWEFRCKGYQSLWSVVSQRREVKQKLSKWPHCCIYVFKASQLILVSEHKHTWDYIVK